MNTMSQLKPLIKLAIIQKKKRANRGMPKKGINLPGLSIKNGNNGLNINIGTPPAGKPKSGGGGLQTLLGQLLGKGKGKGPHQGHGHGMPPMPGKGMPSPAFMKGLKTGFAMANQMCNNPQQGPKGPGMGFIKGFKTGFGVGQQMCGQGQVPGQTPGQTPGQVPGQVPGLNIGINVGAMPPIGTPQPQNNINMLGIGLITPQMQANPLQFNQNFGGLNFNAQNTGFAF